jgi:hypothetical protein
MCSVVYISVRDQCGAPAVECVDICSHFLLAFVVVRNLINLERLTLTNAK